MNTDQVYISRRLLEVIAYASNAHRFQRRKDVKQTAYIHHPIQVACLLLDAGVTSFPVLAAAVLHDTIEDTDVTKSQLEIQFDKTIAAYVEECSDDRTLSKDMRKEEQIRHAATITYGAVLIKLADKITNLNDLCEYAPEWDKSRTQEYIKWCDRVVDTLQRNVTKRLKSGGCSVELNCFDFLMNTYRRVCGKAITICFA